MDGLSGPAKPAQHTVPLKATSATTTLRRSPSAVPTRTIFARDQGSTGLVETPGRSHHRTFSSACHEGLLIGIAYTTAGRRDMRAVRAVRPSSTQLQMSLFLIDAESGQAVMSMLCDPPLSTPTVKVDVG